MTAQLPIIPPQNSEIVRAKICEVLTIEFSGQYAQNNTYPNISKVWEERFRAFNSETEVPTINVTLNSVPYRDKTQLRRIGDAAYNIDVYTNAETTDDTGPADQYSMMLMTKICGMVCSILSNPVYKTLGLAPGIIGFTKVDGFRVLYKSETNDALADVVGRVMFTVSMEETVPPATGVPLHLVDTKVFASESDEGFYYSISV